MKSDSAAAGAFAEATNELPGIERRKMFAYPEVFINGNVAGGLKRRR